MCRRCSNEGHGRVRREWTQLHEWNASLQKVHKVCGVSQAIDGGIRLVIADQFGDHQEAAWTVVQVGVHGKRVRIAGLEQLDQSRVQIRTVDH